MASDTSTLLTPIDVNDAEPAAVPAHAILAAVVPPPPAGTRIVPSIVHRNITPIPSVLGHGARA